MKHRALILALSLVTASVFAQAASAQVYGAVRFGPPAPIVERRPVLPGPGYAWRPGYWQWNGNRYVWRGGYYVRRPYGRTAWIPGHWAQSPHGWVYREGHWS